MNETGHWLYKKSEAELMRHATVSV